MPARGCNKKANCDCSQSRDRDKWVSDHQWELV